jgi:hypothetical protein
VQGSTLGSRPVTKKVAVQKGSCRPVPLVLLAKLVNITSIARVYGVYIYIYVCIIYIYTCFIYLLIYLLIPNRGFEPTNITGGRSPPCE